MTTHLSALIRRYFTPSKNRFYFRNGMSLNKLAVEMESAGGIGTKSNVLSEVISGDRIFTALQAKAFCDVLRIEGDERWELQFAAARDRAEREGFEIAPSTNPRVINMFVRNLARVDDLANAGFWELAVPVLQDIYDAYFDFDDDTFPAVPMVRILSMVELERERLLQSALPHLDLTAGRRIEASWELYDLSSILKTSEAMPTTALEERVWKAHYLRGFDVEEIAKAEGLTEMTVLSVLQSWKEKLFQRLAEDPTSS